MFDRIRIQDAFIGLVGLRQNQNPDFPNLNPPLLFTGTNELIQHPLINIENLDMTSRNYGSYTYPAWDIGTDYEEGDKVTYNDVNYIATADNTGEQPDGSANWEELNLLSEYLEDIFRNAISETVQEVFQRKKLNRQTKTLLQNLRLTDGVGGFTDRIINEGKLVGVEVKLKHNQNIKAVFDRIGLQLTAAVNFNILIYHSSQLQPIKTIAIQHTKIGSFQWHSVEAELAYLTDDYDAGGVFYIMYDQDDLGGAQAIKKKHNWHLPPCSYCNRNEVDYFNLYSKYLYMRTVEVRASDRDGNNLWDLKKTRYVSDNNYGLNFEWTVKCDLTDYLIKQKEVFTYAVKEMTIKKLLESMANSTRQNGLDEKVRLMARSELQSTNVGGMGVIHRVEKNLDEVDFEISALDDTCMPCNTKGGLRIHSIGLSRNG